MPRGGSKKRPMTINDARHGTIRGYRYGCRCTDCKQANRRVNVTRGAALQSDSGDPRHGKITGYNLGCRCIRCVNASVENRSCRNARRVALSPEDTRHGKPAGYAAGCRCAACSAAMTVARSSRIASPQDPRHGTLNGYTSGCRCELCSTAGVSYRAARLNKRIPIKDTEHGTTTGYRHGCRCALCIEAINGYMRKRRRTDFNFRLKSTLQSRLWHAIKAQAATKVDKTLALTGLPISKLKEYLAEKFTTGMAWDNYGEWHIDHIRPCSSFDLTDPEQQKQCFHYTNLQPLWAADNIRKHDSWVPVLDNSHS